MKKYIPLFLILVLIGAYFWTHYEEFSEIRIEKSSPILFCIFGAGLFFYFNGLINNICFQLYGLKLRSAEWFGLSVLNSFLNMVTPFRGGMLATAVYLKKRHNFLITSFLGLMAASTLVIVLANLLMALFLILMLPPSLGEGLRQSSLIAVLVMLGVGLIFAWWAPVLPKMNNRFYNLMAEVFIAWRLIRNNPSALLILILGSFGLILSMAFTAYCTLLAIGTDAGYEASLAIGVFANISSLVAITPSNIGVREVFSSLGAAGYGISSIKIVAASIIERVVLLLLSSLLSLIFYKILFARGDYRSFFFRR